METRCCRARRQGSELPAFDPLSRHCARSVDRRALKNRPTGGPEQSGEREA
jgi:hypothetical protein